VYLNLPPLGFESDTNGGNKISFMPSDIPAQSEGGLGLYHKIMKMNFMFSLRAYYVNIYIYLIYFGSIHWNISGRYDTHDHLIFATEIRLGEVRNFGDMCSCSWSRFPLVQVHMKKTK